MRILLVEDDKELLDDVLTEVEKDYVVDVAYSGVEGTYLSQINDYDVMVFDAELPDMDGVEICRVTRSANIKTPIILLHDSCELSNKVMSLDAGADVNLQKPINIPEVKAQVRALTRRNSSNSGSCILKVGKLEVDCRQKLVLVKGRIVHLRRKEFDLLEYLVINRKRIVPKEEILEHVWEKGIYIFSNTVEVHIKSLRERFRRLAGKNIIRTVRGFGYRIDC
jgi:two-component system OmpR family response regulator